MSGGNNKIKISEWLSNAKLEVLKKCFNDIEIENKVSLCDLFKQLVAKFNGMESAEKSSLLALSVFTLVNYSWETYGSAEENLKLSTDEVYWMFVVLEHAVKFLNPKGLKAQSVFALVQNIWRARKSEIGNYKLNQNVIFAIFLMLHYVFWAVEKSDKKGLKELSAKAAFELVKEVWIVKKDEQKDLKLSSVEIFLIFQVLAEAIGKCGPAELKAQEVFELVEEVLEARKSAKGDLELRQFEIHEMFKTLIRAMEHCNKEGLSAEAVFGLVREVFSKVNDLSKDIARCMLDALCLILKIDEQSKNKMQSRLQEVGLDIENDHIVLKEKTKLQGFANEHCTKLILQIIEEQKLKQQENEEKSKKRQEEIEKIEKESEKKKEKPQKEIEELRKKSEQKKKSNKEKLAKMEQESKEKIEHRENNEKEVKKEKESNSTSKLKYTEDENDFFDLWDSNRLNNSPYYLSIVNKETWQPKKEEEKERKEKNIKESMREKEKKEKQDINNQNNNIKNDQTKTTTLTNINNNQEQKEKEEKNININIDQDNPQNGNIHIDEILKNSKTFVDFCNTLRGNSVDFNQLDFSEKSLGIWNCCKAFFSILFDRLKALFGTKGIDINCSFWNLVYLKASYEYIKSCNDQPQNSDTLHKSQNRLTIGEFSSLIKKARKPAKMAPNLINEDNQNLNK